MTDEDDAEESDRTLETTVRVSMEIRERLKALGSKGETYDEIIERLLEYYEE